MKKIILHSFIMSIALITGACKKHETPSPSTPTTTTTTTTTTTLTLQPDATSGKDAVVWYIQDQTTPHGATNTSNYGSDVEFTSMEWTFSNSPGHLQSLLQFDLSSIPANATITSALLSLYHCDQCIDTTNALSGPNTAILQRVTSTWDENSVTWNTKPSATTQNQVVLPASTTIRQDYTNIDVTTLVKDMLANPSTSFGFQFSQQDTTYYRSLIFASSDHSESALHPKIVIQYQ